MDIRETHVGKTPEERQGYQRYLQGIDTEPTLDESLKFKNSANAGEELVEPTSTKPRHVSFNIRLRDHISGNWLSWLFGIVVFTIGFLVIDSKVSFGRIDTDLTNTKKSLDSVSADLKTLATRVNQNDIQIAENRVRENFIEREVFKKK